MVASEERASAIQPSLQLMKTLPVGSGDKSFGCLMAESSARDVIPLLGLGIPGGGPVAELGLLVIYGGRADGDVGLPELDQARAGQNLRLDRGGWSTRTG
jgi:hypothetical protein